MNLVSCDTCGVVLDKDMLKFPEIVKEDGSIDSTLAIWDRNDYRPIVPCPVCKGVIIQ